VRPLPPTLRDKRRYVVFRVFSEGMLKKQDVARAIMINGL
jgi:RNase P/RNase MRP subunit POP5